jgi:hypothetical protein
MQQYQNNQPPSQRGRRDWISYLFPLPFLLIFVFTQSFAGLVVSVAIMLLLWALIAGTSASSRTRYTPPVQQPTAWSYPPPVQQPYEQGYQGVVNTGGPDTSEESDRLAQLQLLGELYQAGKLTEDEFTRQKQQILQGDVIVEAAQPKASPTVESEGQGEEMQLPYPQQ